VRFRIVGPDPERLLVVLRGLTRTPARAEEDGEVVVSIRVLAFYEPSVRTATLASRYVEDPLFLGSLGQLGRGVRTAAVRVSAAQTGLVRSYALALAAGLAIIAVVFLVVS